MKLVHVVYSLHIGGLERVLVNCVNRLPSNIEHHIVCLTDYSDSFSNLLPDNTKLYRLGKKSGKDFSVYKRFFKLLKSIKPDVVHTYNLATNELQFIAWLARVPVRIHAEHGRDIYDPEGKVTKYRVLRKCLVHFTSKVVAVSGELYSWLKDDLALPKKKVVLIRNGINTEFFVPSSKPREAFNIGHVGRLSPIKNQRLLLQGYALACENDEAFAHSTSLTIVGDGESADELKTLSESLCITENVNFAGAQMDVLKFYQSFDCFVMTSTAEGIPMTLLEAMSCGVAAAVTPVGGMPEVVNDEVGYLFATSNKEESVANTLLALWRNKGKTASLGVNARKRIEQLFSEQAMVNQYQELYGLNDVRD